MSYTQQFSKETLIYVQDTRASFFIAQFIVYSFFFKARKKKRKGINQISINKLTDKLQCSNIKYYPAGKMNEIQVYNIKTKKKQSPTNIYNMNQICKEGK